MTNKTLFWSFFANFCTFCASLRLKRTVFRRLLRKAISMALWVKASLCGKSSLLEQSLPRTPTRLRIISVNPIILSNYFRVLRGEKIREISVNPWLINDLRSTKVYVRKNNLFMQNKANFQKVKLNVTKVLTKDYDKMDTWSIRKNEPKTNPKQTQTNPIPPPPSLADLAGRW